MNISNDELRSLLHNVISCYRDHINVYRSANPKSEAVNDVMEAAQQEHAIDACPVGGEHEWPTKVGEIYTGACQKCGKYR